MRRYIILDMRVIYGSLSSYYRVELMNIYEHERRRTKEKKAYLKLLEIQAPGIQTQRAASFCYSFHEFVKENTFS